MKKSIIITGASRGIGQAIALQSTNVYDRIAITSYHHPEELMDTRDALVKLGIECIAVSGDSGDPSFVQKFVHTVFTKWGQIDALVNNAGISYIGLLSEMDIADWELLLHTNLSSVFYYCRAVIPHMVREHSGRILNISSVWGETGASCEAAYSATKGGVNALTQALGKELAPSRIAVNALSCGAVRTNMNAILSSEETTALEESIPYGRMATPEEVAEFALGILSAPDYLTGQIIRFDGGWL